MRVSGLLGLSLVLAACREPAPPRQEPVRSPPRPSVRAAPPPSAAPAAVAPTQPASRAAAGEIGSADPLTVEAVADDAGWIAFCQARADTDGDGKVAVQVGPGPTLGGDTLQRYLAKSTGLGDEIEDLVAHSGPWVVVQRAGALLLVDTRGGKETDLSTLGADLRDDALPHREHRALAFDSTGERLAYSKSGRVVVRSLATGAELALDPGSGELWRIEMEPTGRWVVARVISSDTNGDKRVTWPAPVRKSPRPCRGPVPSYAAWASRGDEPVVRLLPLAGGSAVTVTGYVTTLGSGVVAREPSGKLVYEENGKREDLTDEKCGAKIVLVDFQKEQLLVACTKPKGRPKLELVSRGRRLPLEVDVAHQSQDLVEGTRERLYPLYPGNDTKLLDLDAGRVTPLEPGDLVLATHRGRALVRRRASLLLTSPGAEPRALSLEVSPALDTLARPPFVVTRPHVIDLESERVLGSVAARPLGLSPDGKVLVASGGDPDGASLAKGPLVWRTPAPRAAGSL